VTGIPSGASSEVRVCVKDVKADIIADSGKWNAGLREDIIFGVKTNTDGLAAADVGVEWRFRWERGRDWRSGRKVWSVRIGVRRRVFRRSERDEAGRMAMGAEG